MEVPNPPADLFPIGSRKRGQRHVSDTKSWREKITKIYKNMVKFTSMFYELVQSIRFVNILYIFKEYIFNVNLIALVNRLRFKNDLYQWYI